MKVRMADIVSEVLEIDKQIMDLQEKKAELLKEMQKKLDALLYNGRELIGE